MGSTVNNQPIGTSIRTLVILACIAVAGVMAFQVSWLLNSYQVSKKQTELDLNDVLDEVVVVYKQLKADSARTILKQLIKSEKDFNYTIFKWPGSTQIAYRDANRSYVMYPLKDTEINTAKANPYIFLLNKINSLPLDGLRLLYGSLLGGKSYPDGSEESKQYKKLIVQFNEMYTDTSVVNRIIRQSMIAKDMNFALQVLYFRDINDIYNLQTNREISSNISSNKIKSSPIEKSKEAVIEVVIRTEPLSEKLQNLQKYISKLNASADTLYIAKPLMYEINDILRDQIPLLVISVKVPASYTLKKMQYSIIGTFLLLVFLAFCIGYMLNLIIRQKKLSEIKNDFISNISHELKTPIATTLAAVQGMQYFDILKDEKKTVQYLATASAELQRLSAMVTKILNSAVFESNDCVLNPTEFDLKEMIEEVINAQHLLGRGNVSITLKHNISNLIFADRTHMQQVITNLIDNAIKYSGKQVNIFLESRQVNAGVEISIQDNGPGIAKEFHKQIFEKFFRVPSPNDHRIKGYGLGLNYIKTIVEKHGGSIALKKSDASGSTFIIFLPQ